MFWSFGTRREFYQTHFVSDLFGCTGFWRSAFSVHKGRSLADLDVDEQVFCFKLKKGLKIQFLQAHCKVSPLKSD